MKRLLLFLICMGAAVALVVVVAERQPANLQHDMRLIDWHAEETAAPASEEVSAGEEPLRGIAAGIDLWLDATPNFGGYNGIEGSAYDGALVDRTVVPAGFHYYVQNEKRREGSEFSSSWYLTMLETMYDLCKGDDFRILRYSDRFFSDALIERHLPGEALDTDRMSSFRRDLMTYAVAPQSHDLFTQMVSSGMEDSLYAPGGGSAYQLTRVQGELENEHSRSQLEQAQAEWKMALDAVPAETDDESPLMHILKNMDTEKLNIIVTDTINLPLQSGRNATRPYEEVFVDRGIFEQKNLSVGFLACKSDYIGLITSLAGEPLAEAFNWGWWAFARNDGVVQYDFPMAAQRSFLVMVIGPQTDVAWFLSGMEGTFDGQKAFAQERLGRLRAHQPDPAKALMRFRYNDQDEALSDFYFEYRTHTVTRTALPLYTASDGAVTFALNGAIAEDMLSIYPDAETGEYADGTITLRVPVERGENAASMHAEQNRFEVVTIRQLTQEGEPQRNSQKVESQYANDPNVQLVPVRDMLYVYRDVTSSAGLNTQSFQPLAQSAGTDGYTLDIAVSGDALAAGYYRVSARVYVTDRAVEQVLPGWMQENEKPEYAPLLALREETTKDSWSQNSNEILTRAQIDARSGESDASWDYSPATMHLRGWHEVSETIVGDLQKMKTSNALRPKRTGWGVEKLGSDLDANVPPVFALFSISTLADQIATAAEVGERLFIDIEFDVYVSNEPFDDAVAREAVMS